MELQEPLERKLSAETQLVLVKVSTRNVEGRSSEEHVPAGRFSAIQAELAKLQEDADVNSMVHAKLEVLEQFTQAHSNNDLRQAIGWLDWLFRLEGYRQKLIPPASEEDENSRWEPFWGALGETMNRAEQAEDWDALLLAIGLCDLLGLSAAGEEKLRLIYDRIGEQAVTRRCLEIKRKPRMETERDLATWLHGLLWARSHKEVNALIRTAAACGVDPHDVLDDVANSFDKPNELVAHLRPQYTEVNKDWGSVMGVWGKWWIIFMQEYSSKCLKRWIAKCGDSRDTRSMEQLWVQYFEPLWVAGCEVAKYVRVKNLKDGAAAVLSRHSQNLSDTEQKEVQDDLRAWLEWCDNCGEGASQLIVEFKEKLRQAVRETLKDLREYDGASLLGKLKRLIS